MKKVVRYIAELFGCVLVNLLLMPFAVWATVQYMSWLGYDLSDWGQPFNAPKFSFGLLWLILVKFIFVGINEEAAFRYMLQDRLLKHTLRFPKFLAVLVASVIFGAAHLGNGFGIPFSIPQAVGAAMAGAWFGYIYERRGLHMAMLAHGFYDVVIVAIVLFT